MPTGPSGPVTPAPVIPVITNGKVAIISIDGLRPDAIQLAGAANILALAARGAYTWNAQTIYPSNTLPAHISMLTGYAPEEHGVTWDDYAPTRGQILVPTLFHAARAKGLRTGMVVGKEKFATFRDTGACDTWVLAAPDDDDVAGRVPTALGARPDLLFVHLPDVDLVGHASKWMSRAVPGRGAPRRRRGGPHRLDAPGRHHGHPHRRPRRPARRARQRQPAGHDDPLGDCRPVRRRRASGSATGIRTVDTAATAAFVLGAVLQPDAAGRAIYEAFVSK